MDRAFLIWSIAHQAWWRPNAAGYCAGIADAGIFFDRSVEEGRDRKVYFEEVKDEIDFEMKVLGRRSGALQIMRETLSATREAA